MHACWNTPWSTFLPTNNIPSPTPPYITAPRPSISSRSFTIPPPPPPPPPPLPRHLDTAIPRDIVTLVRMPYTPPSQRSPAVSATPSPNLSRRSSYQPPKPPAVAARPELPRSTTYLTRHRRTPSIKAPSLAPAAVEQPTPPSSTADRENETSSSSSSLTGASSLRQSPPPVTDSPIPAGAVISPPDSAQNSSDDEETRESRGRQLENLAELQKAIRIIEQNRSSSPNRTAEKVGDANKAFSVVMTEAMDHDHDHHHPAGPAVTEGLRKIIHSRSSTEPVAFIDLRRPETPLAGSDEDSLSDDEGRGFRKPPMVRKKSGELVRPALRPSSARRRPSSMPGTPTFSKAVHFDSHLEHVRHFLQVDRPLAVSAGSSPVEAYESDTEFPFTPLRLAQPVRVERVFLSGDNKTLIGSVAVANLAFNKIVIARFTLDYWKTTSEVVAEYNHDIRQPKHADGYDRFNFNIKLADQANLEAKTMFFCVKYLVNGQEYWDNNASTNFQVDFRKKAKPQNGKRGAIGAAARPANALPKSNKKSPPAARPKSMPVTFDDFADGFDEKYNLEFKQPASEFLGDSHTVRLKGVKSAASIASDNLTRRAPNPNGQAFGNRYDFGASLSAAINAANSALGERSGLVMKPSKRQQKLDPEAEDCTSPLTIKKPATFKPTPLDTRVIAPSGSAAPDSPRPAGTEKPSLASQSYNELLDKYCFFGSVKSSPQLKEGTLRSGQYDGGNDEGYVLGSAESTADNSPVMAERKTSPPTLHTQDATTSPSQSAPRSASPAPMTGFVSAIDKGNIDDLFTECGRKEDGVSDVRSHVYTTSPAYTDTGMFLKHFLRGGMILNHQSSSCILFCLYWDWKQEGGLGGRKRMERATGVVLRGLRMGMTSRSTQLGMRIQIPIGGITTLRSPLLPHLSISTRCIPANPSSRTYSTTSPQPSDPTPDLSHMDPLELAVYTKLSQAFSPTALEVQDISGGCGSMYSINIKSAQFEGLGILKQQRLVNEVLKEEVKGWHGVQLRTGVP
ncbi:hypothetical protein B7494_g3791 [Chlorociboria aeruginascens]|nr:hypothetical protein B7494_g3791 [Chlorociboria aeruginascens]